MPTSSPIAAEAKAPETDAPPSEAAQARALAYGLLADLLAHGLREGNRAAAMTSPALRAAIELSEEGGRSEEAWAEEHQHAFGWASAPFAGSYLDAERRCGGPTSDRIWHLFGKIGFSPNIRREDVEHLSTLLRALAFLSGAEADAHEDGQARAVEALRGWSARLLDEAILPWAPLFACAVRRLGRPFPSALVSQIEELLLYHREDLGAASLPRALPEAGAELEDPETDLRAIAARLVSPARSGLVLGREEIAGLGRALSVPRGFGDREQLMANLLRSAARYERLPDLLRALEGECRAQAEDLSAPRYAILAPTIAPWIERLQESRAWLEGARRRAEEGADLDRGPSERPSEQ